MSRRGQSIPIEFREKPQRSRCLKIICVTWKVLTCIISHVTLVSLVVGYCLGGAYLFQHLELENEIEVKKSIKQKRLNVTDFVWEMTENTDVLRESEWTKKVENRLELFEQEILLAMKQQGWDGDENTTSVQWTFEGSLFYSIIVITTIGYGHIAPRTQYGKVTTIFYAILGIPLMLLCLSNIGDVMASSFRFLYWRVCCYVCTREPKRRRNRLSIRSRSRMSRSQPPPGFRRSIRASQRSTDSGYANAYDIPGSGMHHAYSDPELRYNLNVAGPPPRGGVSEFYRERDCDRDRFHDDYDCTNNMDRQLNQQSNRINQQPRGRFQNRSRNRERLHDRHTIERERNIRNRPPYDSIEDFGNPSIAKKTQSIRSMRGQSAGRDINRVYSQTLPMSYSYRNRTNKNTPKIRSKSVDPRSPTAIFDDVDDELARKTPILCNRYAIDELERRNTDDRQKRISTIIEPPIEDLKLPDKRIGNRRNRSMPPSSRLARDRERDLDRETRDNVLFPMQQQKYSQPSSRYGNQLDIPNRNYGMGGRFNNPDKNRYIDNRFYYNNQYNQPMPTNRMSSYYDNEYGDDDYYDEYEMQQIRRDRRARRSAAAVLPPSPRIMSPMGFAIHRQAKIRNNIDDDSYYDDELDSYGNLSPDNRPVPIWLCVFLVVSYIIAGAFIFQAQEGWSFLDATYFCFITLTTIGFGDFVPSTNNDKNPRTSIALCSLYLLFGISLLAMSFNLVQEEVIANVKSVARRLGILKNEEQIDD